MASKMAATNGTQRRKGGRKAVVGKKTVRRESWKKVLERNLVLEGLSPAEAKQLVAIAAA